MPKLHKSELVDIFLLFSNFSGESYQRLPFIISFYENPSKNIVEAKSPILTSSKLLMRILSGFKSLCRRFSEWI
jgi:hypothetical protein